MILDITTQIQRRANRVAHRAVRKFHRELLHRALTLLGVREPKKYVAAYNARRKYHRVKNLKQ